MPEFDANEDHYIKNKESGFSLYTGPRTLGDIEKRLIEIEQEKPRRIHNASEGYSGSFEDELEAMGIAQLDIEKAVLQMKRQFILDKREGWKARVIWNVAVPIVVAIASAFLVVTTVSQ